MAAFADIQSAVEDAYATERTNGFLCLAAMRTSTTFYAAQQIAAGGRAIDLDACPPWLLAELYGWISIYLKEGSLRWLVPHTGGEVDHSEIAMHLVKTLPPKEQYGLSLDLHVGEVQYPSGRYKSYFTYYSSAETDVIRHGLHREYSETGALTETEYRHGVAIGSRQFDEKGSEV
ncbi:hypothetical protein [Ideonella sp. YS5]|uniref:hypothetical protein n=1 Tax=Ideonella sp. YS5 TaxID=3453714 RepID=UPI003EEB2F0D